MLIQSQARFRAIDGLALILFSAGMVLASCSDDPPSDDPYPVDRETFERVATELERRSFRQFHPSVDASPRRGVVIDFHDGFRMWAQYAQDGHAVYEWELTAADYHIEWTGDVAEIVLLSRRRDVGAVIPRELLGLHSDIGCLHLGQERLRQRRDSLQDQRPEQRPPAAIPGVQFLDPFRCGRIYCRALYPRNILNHPVLPGIQLQVLFPVLTRA